MYSFGVLDMLVLRCLLDIPRRYVQQAVECMSPEFRRQSLVGAFVWEPTA